MIPRSWRWLVVLSLVLGCGLLQLVRGPVPIERKVPVPFAEPGRVSLVSLRGAWLRAAQVATDDYFSGLSTPSKPSSLEECLLRRDSYDVEVWAQEEPRDGGEIDEDAGATDGGAFDAGNRFDAPIPRILFVSISLHWDACDLGESPVLDIGGQYAIDTTTWRIVGWRQ